MFPTEQILSLWIGPASQKLSNHFFSLQAQQFFDEEQDPLRHSSLWTFKDKERQIKIPNAIIYDIQSENLKRIRQVDHKKIIKKMEESSNKDMMSFPIQYAFEKQQKEEQNEEQIDHQAYLYHNWHPTQQNYSIISKKFHQENSPFEYWQSLFKLEQQKYEESIRKRIQKMDYLRLFTVCGDSQMVGFSKQIIEYIRDCCSKKAVVFIDYSQKELKKQEHFLALSDNIIPEVELYASIEKNSLEYPYFNGNQLEASHAPILNAFFAPFLIKESSISEYLQRIITIPRRNMFNIGHTMPIINHKSQLQRGFEIYQYLNAHKRKPKTQCQEQVKPKQQDEDEEDDQIKDEDIPLRINFSNSSFLSLRPEEKKKQNQNSILVGKQQKIKQIYDKLNPLAESYILKGEFKQFQKNFKPNAPLLSIKYLQGIISNNMPNNLHYHKHYNSCYGQIVESYPFHQVLFQHQCFGPNIRTLLNQKSKNKKYQMYEQWRENGLGLGDLYCQQNDDSDD